MDDNVLLSRYVETGCQESFEQIVARHGGWVFSLSLRAVRDRHLAEDVTQAVFLILARKAKTIRAGTPLSGWLFKASRFAVSDALKRRTRMKNRENRFAEFFKATGGEAGAPGGVPLLDSTVADDVSQTLDEAVAFLSESDRQAVLLRFYEQKSLAEIGTIIGITEEAAKKRVARAVERLRKYFAGRGVVASLAVLLLLLSRRSAEAAGFQPAACIAATASSHSLAHAIAEGALKLMAHAQAKLLGAIFAASLAFMVSIPAVGGAIRYITTPPPLAKSTAPNSSAALPDPKYTLTDAPHPDLSEQSRWADLWIGYKGELLWRSDAYRSTSPMPFYLKAAEKGDRPYAVAVDPKGNFYVKPLDSAILAAPIIRNAVLDYDAGPFAPHARVNTMMSIIEPNRSGLSILPNPASGRLEDKDDWRKLRRHDEEDGTIVVEDMKLRMQLWDGDAGDANKSNFAPFAPDFGVEVPEPSSALALAGVAAAALLGRRSRRRRGQD